MKFRYFIIGIVIILLDQLSKLLMIDKHLLIIPSFLELNYTQNTGGAFNIGRLNIVLLLSILIILVIIIFLIKEHKKTANFLPFILLLSGSIGNLIDRIFRGYVIDFINIKLFDFPSFNLADICIVLGIVLIIPFLLKYICENKRADNS